MVTFKSMIIWGIEYKKTNGETFIDMIKMDIE